MKKFAYILGMSLALTACESDYLSTKPDSSVATSTIFESTQNAELAINGICKMMTIRYLSTQGFNGEGTIKTYYGNYPGNDFQKCNLTGWAPLINNTYHERSTTIYDYYPWYYYYKLIGNANAVICNIDEASGKDSDKSFIKAQALTFRAYSYMMMAQLYCHRWMDSNNGASRGLPLRLDQSTGDLPCSTLAEVFNQIYADLDEAIAEFQSSGRTREANDNYSPDLSVAYATYARAALIREDWSKAAANAALARQGYTLMDATEYKDGGFNTPNKEWMWSCYGSSDETLYYYSFFAYQASNASSSNCRSYACAISKELFDQIPETDIRREMFLDPAGESYTKTTSRVPNTSPLYEKARTKYKNKLYSTSYIYAYMQFKFQNTDQPGVGNLNNFRASEMYLIEAEADCHIGGKDAEVQKLMNALVRDSKRDPSYACTKTGADLLKEVKLYRRIELWGEGFDWFDFKRWGEPIVRHSSSDGGSFHAQFAVTIQPNEQNQWTWVIPNKEIDYNSAISTNIE